jgi:hypothetical protein
MVKSIGEFPFQRSTRRVDYGKKAGRWLSLSEDSVGPLLKRVLDAQREEEAATQYPAIEALGRALERVVKEMDGPIVWPLGAAAERIAGAATLLSRGGVQTTGWTDGVADQRVLLLGVASVSPLPFIVAAEHARRLGASEVHACGLTVAGLESSQTESGLDSYRRLSGAPVVGRLTEPESKHEALPEAERTA